MIQLLKASVIPGVRAMSGVCPIPLPRTMGLPITDFEMLDWYFAVQAHSRSQGHVITKAGVIRWLGSIVDDYDTLCVLQDTLWWLAPVA